MEFGICLPTKAQSWAVVQRAEELGFSYAWFYDTQLLSADVLVAMGAAAMKTSRIKLCAGVLHPIQPYRAGGSERARDVKCAGARAHRLWHFHRLYRSANASV